MVDVDAALAAMRQLLGSGEAPQWPQPEFGQPVPPATQWDGDASDRAQQVSQSLDRTRQGLASANAAVPPIIERVAQINSSARTQLDNIEQQWHADQVAFAPLATTPAGKLALTQLGQLRISEGTAVVQNAQAAFTSAASQIQALTGELPVQMPGKTPPQGPTPGPDDTIVGPDGEPTSGTPHVKPADVGLGSPPEQPTNTTVDPNNPFIGDARFGHWEQYLPPPYTGATPPPPEPEHHCAEGLPLGTGGPSGFYTPGRNWATDDQPPSPRSLRSTNSGSPARISPPTPAPPWSMVNLSYNAGSLTPMRANGSRKSISVAAPGPKPVAMRSRALWVA